jgi:hypothetical protein
LAICGHVHEGRGAERVRWDLSASNIKYKESSVVSWEDPGRDNKKLSIVDLTTKGRNPLENDGSNGDYFGEPRARNDVVRNPAPMVSLMGDGNDKPSSKNVKATAILGISRVTTNLLAVPAETLPPATRGQGGTPPSQRCDLAALSGRMGRQETCIVNAAIMASSWPRSEAKKFNKPIVVDIDLPVWRKC